MGTGVDAAPSGHVERDASSRHRNINYTNAAPRQLPSRRVAFHTIFRAGAPPPITLRFPSWISS